MTSLTVDAGTLAVLSQATDLAEIRDAGGNVIGFFAPSKLSSAAQKARVAARYDPEEIRRRKQANLPGYTTAQVFEHLQSLTKDENLRRDLQERIDRLKELDRCDTP